MNKVYQQSHQRTSGEFQTRDIYLATVIKQAGVPIIRIENNGHHGIFVFKNSEEIMSLISRYFNNELRTNPQELFAIWKSLKAQAFSTINNVR